ncbi:MAG: GGDEF domain-containing protein, partial [Phycisphaerae bacterium]
TDWCFPIRHESQVLGVIAVGRIDASAIREREWLEVTAQAVSFCWTMVREMGLRRSSDARDPSTGLLVRQPFLQAAEHTLLACRKEDEPVAVCVLSIEGIRNLTDMGRWDTAEQLMHEAATQLRKKIRSDDEIGRFDDSCFAILLRRVDESLATLIVSQLVNRVEAACQGVASTDTKLKVRSGFANSNAPEHTLQHLLVDALQQCQKARESERSVTSNRKTREVVASGSRES